MGTLVAWHYRSNLFAKMADHTYVTCGNGARRWKCWGGCKGGDALIQGAGETKQANAIAQPDGRAGITCYLINGVCHQSANRVLFPAGITVHGARGYYISESLYGPYGRPHGAFGTCNAPFDRHTGMSGDLPESTVIQGQHIADESDSIAKIANQHPEPERYTEYLRRVNDLYAGAEMKELEVEPAKLLPFQLKLFEELIRFKLGSSFLNKRKTENLQEVRGQIEDERISIENSFGRNNISVDEFVSGFNSLTESFQKQMANILKRGEYTQFLGIEPDDMVVLGDVDIAREYYES